MSIALRILLIWIGKLGVLQNNLMLFSVEQHFRKEANWIYKRFEGTPIVKEALENYFTINLIY